jgi:hypothetical protein
VSLIESLEGCARHIEAIYGLEITEFTVFFGVGFQEVIDGKRLLSDVGVCAFIVFFDPEKRESHVAVVGEFEMQQAVVDLV